MDALDQRYTLKLNDIITRIQNSEALAEYLDTEEYEEYKVLISEFEDDIQELYIEVADNHPLQLVALERAMLDDGLEGLYLPKLVGYSVLRGEVDESYTYRRPQNHFKDILLFIAKSMNFGMIKLRVGQSIQTGFAMSSDIWITNIIDSISNKKVSQFLQSQKDLKFRLPEHRKVAFEKYARQFASLNFDTSTFPETSQQLQQEFFNLRSFLLNRATNGFDNTSIQPHIEAFIENKNIVGTDKHIELLMIIGMFYDLSADAQASFKATFKAMGADGEGLSEAYFKILDSMHKTHLSINREADLRIGSMLKDNSTSEITKYYELLDEVHGKGFVHEESIEAVRNYYLQHQGQSIENECLRFTILTYFEDFMKNIEATEYAEYFEITKIVTQYIGIFSNQKFNQRVKDISLAYIKKLLKQYTDKRGRDYQDIKKFVQTTFTDLQFMTEKELKELFKTKRKKVAKA